MISSQRSDTAASPHDRPASRTRLALARFEMRSPGDLEGVGTALTSLPLDRVTQLAVIAKIEGTATLNDVARELASERIAATLARAGGADLQGKTLEILSVGCEGIITPGGWLVASVAEEHDAATTSGDGLVMAHARSAPVPMSDRASPRHVAIAAATVRSAMRKAGLHPAAVSLVLIKSPILLDAADVRTDAQRRHLASTAASRGAAALGAGIALDRLRQADVDEHALCAQWALHGERVMAFSGTETQCCEAVVFGHRAGGDPRWRMLTVTARDLLDIATMAPLAKAGDPHAILFKAGLAPGGLLRGARTTVFTSELPPDKQLRAAASGIVGALFGTGRAFVSGGAEHQGPPGACTLSVIVRADQTTPSREHSHG